MITEFSKAVCERIGSYVYVLKGPRNGNIFYVGKGKRNRVFQYLNCDLENSTCFISFTERIQFKLLKDLVELQL